MAHLFDLRPLENPFLHISLSHSLNDGFLDTIPDSHVSHKKKWQFLTKIPYLDEPKILKAISNWNVKFFFNVNNSRFSVWWNWIFPFDFNIDFSISFFQIVITKLSSFGLTLKELLFLLWFFKESSMLRGRQVSLLPHFYSLFEIHWMRLIEKYNRKWIHILFAKGCPWCNW